MEYNICCICCDVVEFNDTVLPCNHVYHRNCIERWKEVNPVCPLCHASIEPIDMFPKDFTTIFRMFIFMCYILNLYNVTTSSLDIID